MVGGRSDLTSKSRRKSLGEIVVIFAFAACLLIALAATTGSYSPPHPLRKAEHSQRLRGMNLKGKLDGVLLPVLVIYQGCDSCSAVNPRAVAVRDGIGDLTWSLDSDGRFKNLSSGRTLDGRLLLAALRPEWNPQAYGFDRRGVLNEIQTTSFGDEDYRAFFEKWKKQSEPTRN